MFNDVAIIGAGPTGMLLAMLLNKLNFPVSVFEKSLSLSEQIKNLGYSYNLTLSCRGLSALAELGLDKSVLQFAVPVNKRIIHPQTGDNVVIPYSTADNIIYSINRNNLITVLNKALASTQQTKIYYDTSFKEIDGNCLIVREGETDIDRVVKPLHLFAADGAYSSVRKSCLHHKQFDYQQTYDKRVYKEIFLPASSVSTSNLEKNAIHIWPRKSYMLIGFPNIDGSMTLFLNIPNEDGNCSVKALKNNYNLSSFFKKNFPDIYQLLIKETDQYFGNPIGYVVSMQCYPWTFNNFTTLVGDAAHTFFPYYGQGVNMALEDCLILYKLIKSSGSISQAASDYQKLRWQETNIINNLSKSHFYYLANLPCMNEEFQRKYSRIYEIIAFTQERFFERLSPTSFKFCNDNLEIF